MTYVLRQLIKLFPPKTYANEVLLLIKYWVLAYSKPRNPNYKKCTYGQHKAQHFCYLQPTRNDLNTTIIFFHGGGWQFGSPTGFYSVAAFLADLGYTVFICGHRKIPFYGYPDLQKDTKLCIDQIHTELHNMNRSNQPIILGGMSSGAHLVMDYYLKHDIIIHGLFLLSAPLDFNQMRSTWSLRQFTNTKKKDWSTIANPINHLKAASTPVLLIHGDQDAIVEVQSSQSFFEKYRSYNEVANYKELKGANHISVALWSLQETESRAQLLLWLNQLRNL